MSGLTDDWDAVPIKGQPPSSQAPAQSSAGSLTSDWDAVPVKGEKPLRIETSGTRRSSQANQIPGNENALDGNRNIGKPDNSSLADKLIGGVEAGASMLTGAAASIPAAAAGVLSALGNGKMGTQQGVNEAADAYGKMADAFTYQPRTATGQQYAHAVGQVVNDSGIGVLPFMPELSRLGGVAAPVTQKVGNVASDFRKMFAERRSGMPITERIEPVLTKQQTPSSGSSVAPSSSPGLPQQPSLAESTPAPELRNASPQVQKYVNSNLKSMTPEEIARHIEADSLPVPARLTQGQGSQDVHQISFEQNNKGKNPDLGNLFNSQNQNLIDNVNAIREKAAPDVTVSNPVEAGQNLIDSYKNLDAKLSSDISSKYQALKDANGGQFPLDAKTFVDNADQALHRDLLYDHVAASIRSTLDRLKNGGSMTFENFESLRTNLARLQRSPTLDGNAQAAAGVIRNALEDVPMPPGAEQLKPLADQARAAARARFQLIDSDPAYAAVVKDDAKIGEPSPLADKFIDNYVVKGKAANVRNMINNLAEDSAAKKTIAAGVIDHLKSSAGIDLRTNTGNFSQAGYNKALTNISPKLGLILDAESARNAQTLGNVARYQQFQPRGSYVNNSNTLTGAAAELAKNGATLGANALFNGIPVGSAVRAAAQYIGKAKQVKQSLGPAGLTKLSEFPK